jgi:hypothetical protein
MQMRMSGPGVAVDDVAELLIEASGIELFVEGLTCNEQGVLRRADEPIVGTGIPEYDGEIGLSIDCIVEAENALPPFAAFARR